jgi:5-formyltetrahydrofolate cyclo-ligase
MLICDTKGYRVGYGKGFYDRYLAHCRKDVVKIGFSYFDPVEKITDTDQFDVPLTYCITPQHIYEF